MKPLTLTPIIIDYLEERTGRGELEPKTVHDYRQHLFDFALVFGRRPKTQLGGWVVERWIADMHGRGLAPSTQATRLSTVRTFARWCAVRRVTQFDFTLAAPKIRRPRQIPRDMTNAHVDAVIATARNEREDLLIMLMFGAGLRCIEVHRLDVEDLDRRSSALFVVGKARHERTVPIPPAVISSIDSYLAVAGHRTGALIRSACDNNRRLGVERISGLVNFLVRESGVKVKPYDGRSAHGIRSAAASDMYDACHDVAVVQQFLGHANISTTSRYLRRATDDRVRTAQSARYVRRRPDRAA